MNANELFDARVKKRFKRFFRRALTRTSDAIYYSIILGLSWWPLGLFRARRRRLPIRDKRIAYYTWHFPVLSQTFIHRELAALKKSGLRVEIIADGSENPELSDEDARSLLSDAHYLEPLDETLLRQYKTFFLLRRPLACLNLFFFVMTHRYGQFKMFVHDKLVFSKAIYLAGMLKDRRIDHLHSPWADESAFVALLAAKLLRVPYSVQGRAHDIHRKTYLYALREKFENAEFVVTNTCYNQSYMKSLIKEHHWRKIATIHNGIDLDKFIPRQEPKSQATSVRILCVARLIEQKGLIYLLKTCQLLRERGYSFTCEIIGAPEEPLYTNYFIALKKLHRRLALEDCVFFGGAQPFEEVLSKYRTADIFILPSVIAADGSRDITPNSLIEAMAMKLPVISTTITGIPEIVEDGTSGILVPPHDEHGLADAVIKLIEDSALRKELGENARKRVEEKFNIDRNIRRYVDLFSGNCAECEGGEIVYLSSSGKEPLRET